MLLWPICEPCRPKSDNRSTRILIYLRADTSLPAYSLSWAIASRRTYEFNPCRTLRIETQRELGFPFAGRRVIIRAG